MRGGRDGPRAPRGGKSSAGKPFAGKRAPAGRGGRQDRQRGRADDRPQSSGKSRDMRGDFKADRRGGKFDSKPGGRPGGKFGDKSAGRPNRRFDAKFDVTPGPPQMFMDLITSEIARWRPIIQAAGIRAE